MKKRKIRKKIIKNKQKDIKEFNLVLILYVIIKIPIILILITFHIYIFLKLKNIRQYQTLVFPEIVSFENNLNLTREIFSDFLQINQENKLIEKNVKFKKSKRPDITVIITVYNKADNLHKSIRSIQNQSLKNVEIIIVDDCSIDNSIDIIKEYQKDDPRIILLSHDSNEGIIKSRSDGIRKAKGKYITIIDADDLFIHKDILNNSLFIAKKANLDVVQFHYIMASYEKGELKEIIDEYPFTNISNIIYQPELSTKFYWIGENVDFYIRNRIIWGKLIKKELFQKILINIGTEYTDDYINEAEDTIMAISLYHLAESFYLMKEIGYYYFFEPNKNKINLVNNKVCKANNKLKNFDRYKFCKFLLEKYNRDENDKKVIYNELLQFDHRKYLNMTLEDRHYKIMFFIYDKILDWDFLDYNQREFVKQLKNEVIQKKNNAEKENYFIKINFNG